MQLKALRGSLSVKAENGVQFSVVSRLKWCGSTHSTDDERTIDAKHIKAG